MDNCITRENTEKLTMLPAPTKEASSITDTKKTPASSKAQEIVDINAEKANNAV